MINYQWVLVFIIYLLLMNKVSNTDASILLSAYVSYQLLVIPLDTLYYSCSALLNLLVGSALHKRNKPAAICSYSLVLCSVFGYALWLGYYEPYIYDKICLLILLIQILTITPKGLLNGLRNNIQHTMAKFTIFNSFQTRVTMYKINSLKKENKTMKENAIQVIETIVSDPKVSLGITAAFTSNAWVDYGLPAVQGVTTIAGMCVVVLLIIKHALDIKKEHFTKIKD